MGWGAAKWGRATSGCSAPQQHHWPSWETMLGDGGLGNSQLIAQEGLKPYHDGKFSWERATSKAHAGLPAWLAGYFSGFSFPQSWGLCTLLSTTGRNTTTPGRLPVSIPSLYIVNIRWCAYFPLKIPVHLDFGVEVSVENCCITHSLFLLPMESCCGFMTFVIGIPHHALMRALSLVPWHNRVGTFRHCWPSRNQQLAQELRLFQPNLSHEVNRGHGEGVKAGIKAEKASVTICRAISN